MGFLGEQTGLGFRVEQTGLGLTVYLNFATVEGQQKTKICEGHVSKRGALQYMQTMIVQDLLFQVPSCSHGDS